MGIPYIYDFLKETMIIGDTTYEKTLSHVDKVKKDVISGLEDELWMYDFVHRWERPDCISREAFEAESEAFVHSFSKPKPLSARRSIADDSSNQLSFDDILDTMIDGKRKKKTKPKQATKNKARKKMVKKQRKKNHKKR